MTLINNNLIFNLIKKKPNLDFYYLFHIYILYYKHINI